MVETKIFLPDDIDRFAALSIDYSPLHCDSDYARKTMYGEPVVHGILGVLECLKNHNRRISYLEAQFLKPMFCHIPYHVSGNEILDGNTKMLRLKVKNSEEDYIYALPALRETPQRLHAKDMNITEILEKQTFEGEYSICAENTLYSALFWSSWFVGMEVPGKQALYSKIKLNVESQENITTSFNYKVSIEEYHEKFNLLCMRFELYSNNRIFANGALEVFVRPKISSPIYRKSTLPLEMQNKFNGKTALVTGASRGFGAAIAQVLAAMGANVYINFQKSLTEAMELQKIIKEQGGNAELLQSDVLKIAEFAQDIDILVLNAAPPTLALTLSLGPSYVDRIQSYVSTAFNYALSPLSTFASKLNEKGGYCLVVSSGYMDFVEPEFPHYLCSKAAIEMLAVCTAKKYKNTKYLIIRPPKMLTDMSNSAAGNANAKNPLEIAEKACMKLLESKEGCAHFYSN